MISIIIGVDQGTYTATAGTRTISLSNLDFTPTIESLLYVYNITQDKTYYAAASAHNKCSISGNDITFQGFFPVLRESDKIHIQFGYDSITASGNTKYSLEEINPSVVTDFPLQVARGLVTNIKSVNKFGAAPDGIQIGLTDVWSRADSTPTQQIWLAPTAARIHAIVSTSTNDDGSPVGTGARTIRIYGLKTWDTEESTEDIILNGTGSVNTVNSYVIIHRMKVLTCGASGPNVGIISATAAGDNTVTAIIDIGDGQTEMAIYGVPSIQNFYMTRWACGVSKSVSAAALTFELRVNETPNVNTTCYLRKNDMSVHSTGSNQVEKRFYNPIKFEGPCIIKIQGYSSAADTDAKAAFDGYLVTE